MQIDNILVLLTTTIQYIGIVNYYNTIYCRQYIAIYCMNNIFLRRAADNAVLLSAMLDLVLAAPLPSTGRVRFSTWKQPVHARTL